MCKVVKRQNSLDRFGSININYTFIYTIKGSCHQTLIGKYNIKAQFNSIVILKYGFSVTFTHFNLLKSDSISTLYIKHKIVENHTNKIVEIEIQQIA